MEDESTEEVSDFEFESDSSFIASDNDVDDELTWDSGDSRPPGPSPPSTPSTMSQSSVIIRVRLRPMRRRVQPLPQIPTEDQIPVDDDSSDEESVNTVSQASTANEQPQVVVIDPPTVNEEQDSDATNLSLEPHSPPNSPPTDVVNSPVYSPHSPVYPPSDDEVEVVELAPHSPDYPPPPSSPTGATEPSGDDVEVVELAPYSPEYPPSSPTEAPEPSGDDVVLVHVPEQVRALYNRALSITAPGSSDGNVLPPQKIPATVVSVPAPVALDSSVLSEGDDSSLCSICMDPLTNSGNHRVVCLKCGHIFGHSCLERWIKAGCNHGAKRCPTCNKKACLRDIRVLYLSKVVPLDTILKDRLVQEKEEALAQKRALEMELSRWKLQNDLNVKKYEFKLQKLEEKYSRAKEAIEMFKQGRNVVLPYNEVGKETKAAVTLWRTTDISKDGGCRVLAFNNLNKALVVSQPSGNTVFAGFGIRVLNSVDFQPIRFIFLHQKMIRDMAFHNEDKDLLLTVSLDQTAKLVDMNHGTTLHTFRGEGPLWACAWDASNPHLMLVGSQMGRVIQYDRRMLDHHLHSWEPGNNHTPVVSLASAPAVANTPFPQGGFFSCRLNGVFSYARYGDTYRRQELPLEGPFMSMKYDISSQSLLTASRPSSRCPYAKISLNLVDSDKGTLCLPQIHQFSCGSSSRVLSRLTTFPGLGDMYVVGHHESGRSVNLWSSKSGSLVHNIPIKDPVIDMTAMPMSHDRCLLAALSDKRVNLYNIS